MTDELVKYISRYVEMTDTLKTALTESAFVKQYPKGTVLLKPGDISNECYFIFKGCIRDYYMEDIEEKTIEFYTEEQVASPPCYGTNTPSEQYLECIEDTIASVGTPELETEMFQKYPELESLARVMNDMVIASQQNEFKLFKFSSPEQRYLNLLEKRPDLIQRVPQHQIASYLGMKPESLSRIRRRLAKK